MAEALYRKYRPQIFEDVVGQEPIERTLKNAIAQDKVSHAYLFCGPRGTGKTTTARLLAKALLCQRGPTPDPDGSCEDCQLIAEGAHPDVYELDAASRTGVENVREEIISRVHFAPTRGRYKVYIIDEVHMLSTAAFNALLKTLEEPPSHVVFVLCTTDPQKVPETIHSRCQRFDFHRISPESMVARLGAICMAEDVTFEGEALDLIAQRADGGLRDALTSLEQIIAFENGKVTLAGAERLLGSIDSNDLAEIMAYVGRRDIANCFRWTAAYVETGADLAQFTRDMAEHVRNLYIMTVVGDDVDLDVTETTRQQLAAELAWFGQERAVRLLGVLGDLMAELKTTSNPRLAFEIALTRMVRPDSDLTLQSLAERVEALESGYSAVAHVLPGPAVGAAPHMPDDAGGAAPVVRPPAGQDGGRQAQAAQPLPGEPQHGSGGGALDVRGAAPDAGGPSSMRERSGGEAGGTVPAGADGVEAPAGFRDQRTVAGAGPAEQPVPAVQGTREAENAVKPAAQQAAAAVASKVAALSNPAALQRIWQATLSEVKRRKQSHGVLFLNTKAAFDAATGRVNVVFPTEATFAFNAVQKPDVQDALQEALTKAVGEPVPFSLVRVDDAGAVPTASAHAPMPSPAAAGPVSAPARDAGPVQEAGRDARFAVAPVQSGGGEAPVTQPAMAAEPARSETPERPGAGSEPAFNPPHFDEVPYEQVPYDDVPYDYVPYDDVPYEGAADAPVAIDTVSSATQVDSHRGPTGALQEDPAALQDMLRASFGDSVVLSETDE